MNGTSNGIVPTFDLTGNGNGWSNMGEWIIGLVALGMLGNGGLFGGYGNNNFATTEYVSSEFTQRDVTNGTQAVLGAVSNGFADNATNICNLRSDVLLGNAGVQSAIYNTSNATQRDILNQTNEINTSLLTTALQSQAQAANNQLQMQGHLDNCCCELKAQGIENTQKILDAMKQSTIDALRSENNDLKNTITATGIGTSIVNQVRPYPIPAYPVSSPYVGLYNGGFYGNGFYGNTIV